MAAAAAVQKITHQWEFPIEASEMGRIFPRDGIVHLIFASAEKAAAFQEKYPTIGDSERTYTLIVSQRNGKNLEIQGSLWAVEAINALYQAIEREAPKEAIIENPYTFTLLS